MTAITVTVMPAAMSPYSTPLVTPANTTRDVLRGYRKIELATAVPPPVLWTPFAVKTLAAKAFRPVKLPVSRNATLDSVKQTIDEGRTPAAAGCAFYSAATGAARRMWKDLISSRRYGNSMAPTSTRRLHSDSASSSAALNREAIGARGVIMGYESCALA